VTSTEAGMAQKNVPSSPNPQVKFATGVKIEIDAGTSVAADEEDEKDKQHIDPKLYHMWEQATKVKFEIVYHNMCFHEDFL